MIEKDENIKEENDNLEEQIEIQAESDEMLVENIEDNGEEIEDVQQVIDTYLDEDDIEEVQVIEKKKCGCFAKLGANLIDQGIGLAVSFVLLYAFNAIIGFVGYRVSNKVSVFLVIYVLFNILYAIILESTKLKKTIGKSIVKL